MAVRELQAVRETRRAAQVACCLVALAVIAALLTLAQPAGAAGLRYSQTPSHTEPYAACPAPTSNRAQCLAIVDPKPSLLAPVGKEKHPASPGASPAAGPQLFCREVFPGSEYEGCGSGAGHGFSPQDLQSAYRLPSETAGSGQTVAIVDAFDDPNAQADLNMYRSTYGLPPCESGCFTKVNQTGGTTYPEANEGWGLEISLDLDMVSAACPKCHILLVEAQNNLLESLGIAENQAATLGATEISNSYDANEIEVGKVQLEEDSAKYYTHPGVPITVASGDSSWDDTNPCSDKEGKCINVSPNYPADLSKVVAVGGTNINPTGESGRGWNESVWFNSGSGCTLYVAKPAWQTDKGCSKRTDNDVAAVAEGVSVYDTYSSEPGWRVVGGTSASAPATAAAIALESSTLRAEGLEGIYKHSGNWFDVTEGLNYGIETCAPEIYLCHAEIGYDGPTGVGTPDGGATATPPSAWTEPASAVTTTAGVLNGIVNPEAGAGTTYYFQYGSSTYYGRTAPIGGAKAAGYTQPSRVSQAISGLKAATRYHFRVVTKNANGVTYGADQTFSTAAKVPVATFGKKGASEGQFNTAQFTALNSEGDVWVSDYANNRVEEFSASGTFMKACGTAGSGEGQFNGPTGIAVFGRQIYVSDSGNNRVEVLGENCSYWDSFGQGFLSDPMGLAFTAGGSYTRGLVLVANAGGNDIEVFSTRTSVVGEKRFQEHEGTYGSKGSGEGQFLNPTDVIFAGKENTKTQLFYAVDSGNNRVQEFSVSGLYTASKEEPLTYKFDEAFGSVGSGEGQFKTPTAAVLDPSTGDVDVTDTGNNRVEQFLPTGAYVAKFGSGGIGSGSFNKPLGIAASPTGTLYIADSTNYRVGIWGSSETTNPEWFITATRSPTKTLNSYLWGVSCVKEVASCSAVGEHTTGEGGRSETMAESWNGVEWTLQEPPSPSEYSSLYGVSCASTTSCVGVGSYKNKAGTYLSLVDSWNGINWETQTVPEPSGTLNSGLDAASCTSATACTVVGEYENSSGSVLPFADRWNGSEWKVQAVPAPTGATETRATGVSCISATVCAMAGSYKNSSGVRVPYAEWWNGTEWTTQAMTIPTGATETRVSGVSCASSISCTASGYYISGGVQVQLAEHWGGVEWKVQPTVTPTEVKASSFSGVSCATTKACTAVGVSLNNVGQYVTLTERWNGSEWKILPSLNGEKGEGWLTGGVSCSAALVPCVAVGNTGLALAEVYG